MLYSNHAAQATAQTGGDLFYITGYSIDQNGNITFLLWNGGVGLDLERSPRSSRFQSVRASPIIP